MFNNIWSLGIILLNLATGRNPWKSAAADDPTFQTYLRRPLNFLRSVLPISSEVNDILSLFLRKNPFCSPFS
jgi:serine/threonine protein kinase